MSISFIRVREKKRKLIKTSAGIFSPPSGPTTTWIMDIKPPNASQFLYFAMISQDPRWQACQRPGQVAFHLVAEKIKFPTK